MSTYDPASTIAQELGLSPASVAAVVQLLSEGATVPFIARYRKEATGGLDEVKIRTVEERRAYLLELHERKETILKEIGEQKKLTPELERQIHAATTKAKLEDLYLPFKPKRRTRAILARERGLGPLAEKMAAQGSGTTPRQEAAKYVDPARGVEDAEAALAGARDICAEQLAENAAVRALVRDAFARRGVIEVVKAKEFAEQVTKFDTYSAFEEAISTLPSHRYLAISRGEAEGVLKASLKIDVDLAPQLESLARLKRSSPWADDFSAAIRDAFKRLIAPSVQADVRAELKAGADRKAVEIFAQNLRELLLAAPFGGKPVLGVDPGQRTGCKCAVVDETGKLAAYEVLYLVQGEEALARAAKALLALCRKHAIAAVAVGNGTHGREAETFVRATLKDGGLGGIVVVSVSEAGASVYSASEVAREEFPDLDLTVRGAISIARRLQDPLAELVKVDPKSIGIGQYQHDVSQTLLAKKLDDVVESCVSSVGVELNTASAPLLARVPGLGPSLAQRIVAHRNAHGRFKSRKELRKVSGLGAKTFEQAAGFLRIREGAHPLDSSAVHPERYLLVERIAEDLAVEVEALIGNDKLIEAIEIERYLGGDLGRFTMDDILGELRKPGRDPRKCFEPPAFRDDVRTLEDLKPGMELEGVVTNVTAFGAFVDVGVHQDGLVHVSKLADRYVKDPNEVVKVGDRIRVRVVDVDLIRKRIGLSARKELPTGNAPQASMRAGRSGKR
jgi:uncharacterized protein